MAIVRVQRPQTALEALGPQVEKLFEQIDRSKRLRGERQQVESVLEAIRSSPEGATPEEVQQRIIGGLQATRDRARDTGVLGRMFDVNVPRFDEVTPTERGIANLGVQRAFEDPLIRQTREANLAGIIARTDATNAMVEARTRAATGFKSDEEEFKFWQDSMVKAAGRYFGTTEQAEPAFRDAYEFSKLQFQAVKSRIEGRGAPQEQIAQPSAEEIQRWKQQLDPKSAAEFQGIIERGDPDELDQAIAIMRQAFGNGAIGQAPAGGLPRAFPNNTAGIPLRQRATR